MYVYKKILLPAHHISRCTQLPPVRRISAVVSSSAPNSEFSKRVKHNCFKNNAFLTSLSLGLLGLGYLGYTCKDDFEIILEKWAVDKWDYEWDRYWWHTHGQYEKEQSSCVKKRTVIDRNVNTSRQLILVRHGQYKNVNAESDNLKGLTTLGVEQANLVGLHLSKRLAGKKVLSIRHSNLKRAQETARIIGMYFKDVKLIEDEKLAEGVPTYPKPPLENFNPSQSIVKQDSERIEAAFQENFYRPPKLQCESESEEEFETYDILVCHGNVIRYMFCRALQFPASAWLRLSIYNCGVTWLSIDDKGYVSARELGNVGFIPAEKITYT